MCYIISCNAYLLILGNQITEFLSLPHHLIDHHVRHLFSIFSKRGILLWCFKGKISSSWKTNPNQPPACRSWTASWRMGSFNPHHQFNELIKSVLLQERALKKDYWESGQLALRYKMIGDAIKSEYEIEIVVIEQDNEFELVFVIVY